MGVSAVRINSQGPVELIFRCFPIAIVEKGMYREAIAEATRARDLSGGHAEAIATIGYALAISGKRDEARLCSTS